MKEPTVRTHPFDAVSFTFGAIFVAVAVIGLTDLATLTVVDLRWIGPAVLVLVGVVLVVSAARRDDGGGRAPEVSAPSDRHLEE
jgi:drug/metabolite transporter superfamily protein YnfA